MNRLVHILLMSVLAALFVGCGGSHDARVMAELDRADSLLRTSDTAAHSAALRQMVALDTARALRADEALRARHALLLVQARYKCYVTIPADSALIDIAYRYYADHHSGSADHERYTRTLIYKGAVAEELGHPEEAIRSYKNALNELSPSDHYNQGYVNMRMAELFHARFQSDSITCAFYQKAIYHFNFTLSSNYLIACYTDLGSLYRLFKPDSAAHCLKVAMGMAMRNDRIDDFYKAKVMLAGHYFNQRDYVAANKMAMDVINHSSVDVAGTDQFYIAADTYSLMGNPDSAESILMMAPKPTSSVDSMLNYKSLSEIAKARNNKNLYIYFREKSASIADSIVINANKMNLPEKDKIIENEMLQGRQLRLEKDNGFLITLSIAILFISIVIIVSIWISKKRIKTKNQQTEQNFSTYYKLFIETQEMLRFSQDDIKHLQKLNNELSSEFHLLQSHKPTLQHLDKYISGQLKNIQQLIEISNHKHKSPEFFMQEFRSRISIGKPDKSFWGELHHYVDWKYKGIISYLVKHYPNLSDSDVQFMCLCYCGFSNTLIMMCTGITNIKTITNKKLLIPKNKMGLNKTIDKILEEYLSGGLSI